MMFKAKHSNDGKSQAAVAELISRSRLGEQLRSLDECSLERLLPFAEGPSSSVLATCLGSFSHDLVAPSHPLSFLAF